MWFFIVKKFVIDDFYNRNEFLWKFFFIKKNLFTAETSEVCQSSTFRFSTFKPIRTDHRELRNFLLLSKHYYQTVVTIWGFEQIKWNIKEMLKKKDFNFVIQTILKHIIKHYFLRFFFLLSFECLNECELVIFTWIQVSLA